MQMRYVRFVERDRCDADDARKRTVIWLARSRNELLVGALRNQRRVTNQTSRHQLARVLRLLNRKQIYRAPRRTVERAVVERQSIRHLKRVRTRLRIQSTTRFFRGKRIFFQAKACQPTNLQWATDYLRSEGAATRHANAVLLTRGDTRVQHDRDTRFDRFKRAHDARRQLAYHACFTHATFKSRPWIRTLKNTRHERFCRYRFEPRRQRIFDNHRFFSTISITITQVRRDHINLPIRTTTRNLSHSRHIRQHRYEFYFLKAKRPREHHFIRTASARATRDTHTPRAEHIFKCRLQFFMRQRARNNHHLRLQRQTKKHRARPINCDLLNLIDTHTGLKVRRTRTRAHTPPRQQRFCGSNRRAQAAHQHTSQDQSENTPLQ